MKEYPSAVRPYGRKPGTRLWASGFHLSSPPSRIIRNMPPTLVELTCGARTPESEKEARKRVACADAIAPVIDGEPALKRTTSFNDVAFFTDKADAKAYYHDCVSLAAKHINKVIGELNSMKDRVDRICDNGSKKTR